VTTNESAPGRCCNSAEGKEPIHHLKGSSMEDPILYATCAVLHLLADIAATPQEILDNSDFVLGSALSPTELVHLDPAIDYRRVPLIDIHNIDEVRERILDERATTEVLNSVPAPAGLDDHDPYTRNGYRTWSRPFETHSSAQVYLTVADEVTKTGVERSAPFLEIYCEGEFQADQVHALIDALTDALRGLSAMGEF
jgi:hypothetical protein